MHWRLLQSRNLTPLLLRLALAIMFLYAAISSFVSPHEWVGYLPPLMTDIVDADILLTFFSVYELTLAGLLLAGVYVRYVALLCAVTLIGIVILNFELFAISFRDIGLALAALALAAHPQATSRKHQ